MEQLALQARTEQLEQRELKECQALQEPLEYKDHKD